MRSIRITIEPSRIRWRVWLKAVDNRGHAEVILNIPRWDVVRLRDKLFDKLIASGLYDEVTGDPIPEFPSTAPKNAWTIDKITKGKK